MSVVNTNQRQKIVIVNTGCANISSVRFALERLGVEVDVSDDVNVIKSADKVFYRVLVPRQPLWQALSKKPWWKPFRR